MKRKRYQDNRSQWKTRWEKVNDTNGNHEYAIIDDTINKGLHLKALWDSVNAPLSTNFKCQLGI